MTAGYVLVPHGVGEHGAEEQRDAARETLHPREVALRRPEATIGTSHTRAETTQEQHALHFPKCRQALSQVAALLT